MYKSYRKKRASICINGIVGSGKTYTVQHVTSKKVKKSFQGNSCDKPDRLISQVFFEDIAYAIFEKLKKNTDFDGSNDIWDWSTVIGTTRPIYVFKELMEKTE